MPVAQLSSSPQKRKYKKPTPDRLANIALYYLSRYAASEASLRRVLENRIRKAMMQDEDLAADQTQQQKLKQAIDDIVGRHKKSGAIDDAAYAETKVRSLRRSGGSNRKIALKLQQKGIAADLIDLALLKAQEEDPDFTESKAALAFAKRRRLGPYRSKLTWERMNEEKRAKSKDKDYAAMARAGFSFDIIRNVLDDQEEEDSYQSDWSQKEPAQ